MAHCFLELKVHSSVDTGLNHYCHPVLRLMWNLVMEIIFLSLPVMRQESLRQTIKAQLIPSASTSPSQVTANLEDCCLPLRSSIRKGIYRLRVF